MDTYERVHVCDGIKEVKFKEGEFIINEVYNSLDQREMLVISFI